MTTQTDLDLFRAVVMHHDGGANIVLIGDWDLAGHLTFAGTVHPLLARYDIEQITFDCSRLTFLNAGAVGQLIGVRNRMSGGNLNLVGVSAKMLRFLQILQADHLFNLQPLSAV